MMKMFKKIDGILNKMTMYRAVLCCLLLLLAAAFGLSFFNLLTFQPFDLIASAVFILAACFFANAVFAWAYNAPSNVESVYITALILALIITPAKPSFDNLLFLSWVSVLAMASKYILAVGKKHLFNPAAISLVLITLASNKSASWWIANLYMMPFVIIGGLLVVRKIKRFDLVWSFFIASLLTISIFNLVNGQNLFSGLQKALVYSPMLFFAFIMLTEPMTLPPTKILRICYGALVGFLFAPQIHIGSLYFTPELVLVAGSVFSYLVSSDKKLILTLEKRAELAPGIYDFEFTSDQKLVFNPGQYMEFTLEHTEQDSRGIRRYLTIASSPTEQQIRLGVKFYDKPSSFKKSLMLVKPGQKIVASQLAGDFTLPRDKNKKLVFIAGGIGITPFRSMIKYLLDTNEKRSIVLFYLNKTCNDFAYKNIFDKGELQLGIKVVYSIVDIPSASYYQAITKEVPDWQERFFYISGPPSMVSAFETNLKKIGVKKSHIKTDYFPGFA
jgi:ferredoxin-NADP reductase/Na+-translocating ferredoxin:NAD+ oxidoreductase RnfD subunit